MQSLIIVAILLSSLLAISQVSCHEAMLSPPNRPSAFRTPDQLRRYLKALNDYYAIVGRPRFGRSVNKRSLSRDLFGAVDMDTDDFSLPFYDTEATY